MESGLKTMKPRVGDKALDVRTKGSDFWQISQDYNPGADRSVQRTLLNIPSCLSSPAASSSGITVRFSRSMLQWFEVTDGELKLIP